jgi:predicted metal-dependent hydrolase
MESLPPEFWQAVDQFNQRQFYDCHDTLEALWMEALEPDKRFYQGILQIAVGLYHLGNENWRGAVILMGEGLNRLRDYQPDYGNVDVEKFLSQIAQLLKILQQIGPEQVSSVIQQMEASEHGSELIGNEAIGFPVIERNFLGGAI